MGPHMKPQFSLRTFCIAQAVVFLLCWCVKDVVWWEYGPDSDPGMHYCVDLRFPWRSWFRALVEDDGDVALDFGYYWPDGRGGGLNGNWRRVVIVEMPPQPPTGPHDAPGK
jgi:hypothetical protein